MFSHRSHGLTQMLVAHVLPRNPRNPRNPQKSQKLGCVSGCVGMAGCHTLLIRENPCVLWDALSSKKVSVCSVHSVGILMFSHRSHGLTQMLVAHVLPRNPRNPRNPQKSQKLGCVSGCVGMAGYHTLLIRAICGRPSSSRSFRAFCGNIDVLPYVSPSTALRRTWCGILLVRVRRERGRRPAPSSSVARAIARCPTPCASW